LVSSKVTGIDKYFLDNFAGGVKMETATKKQALLKAIYERLEQVYEGTLEEILELLDICEGEDTEDIADAIAELKDAEVNGTISWEQYQQELKS
jgi:hypothetical protein